jgi:hypothetical protein
MSSSIRRFVFAALFAGLAGPSVYAWQPPSGDPPPNMVMRQRPPTDVSQPSMQTQVGGGPTVNRTVAPTVNPNAFAPVGFSPYGFTPYVSPAYGFLSGAADVINANGQYLNSVQDARLRQSQADMSKLDLRQRIIQQKQYEYSLMPNPEDVRQKEMMERLRRSRNDPPLTEIWSGDALNSLFMAIQRGQKQGLRGPKVPLADSLLNRINVTTGTTTAGAGMLRNVTRFEWPLILTDAAFSKEREQIEKLAREAVDQVGSGPVAPATIRSLNTAVAAMESTIKRKVADITPTEYVQGMRYVRELRDSFKVFQDPNASNYFNGKFTARGPTVYDLVNQMSSQGLRFAPAARGDEDAYTSLHRALVIYDYGMSQYASR